MGLLFLLILFSYWFTVAAINSLYVALEFPPLDKWLPLGGDPCGDSWQGVLCVFSNVTEMYVDPFFFFNCMYDFQ